MVSLEWLENEGRTIRGMGRKGQAQRAETAAIRALIRPAHAARRCDRAEPVAKSMNARQFLPGKKVLVPPREAHHHIW